MHLLIILKAKIIIIVLITNLLPNSYIVLHIIQSWLLVIVGKLGLHKDFNKRSNLSIFIKKQ